MHPISTAKSFLILSLMAMNNAYAWQPCPVGSSPWHLFSFAMVALYIISILIGSLFIYRIIKRRKNKVILVLFVMLCLTLLVLGTLGLIFHFSAVGSCR